MTNSLFGNAYSRCHTSITAVKKLCWHFLIGSTCKSLSNSLLYYCYYQNCNSMLPYFPLTCILKAASVNTHKAVSNWCSKQNKFEQSKWLHTHAYTCLCISYHWCDHRLLVNVSIDLLINLVNLRFFILPSLLSMTMPVTPLWLAILLTVSSTSACYKHQGTGNYNNIIIISYII